MIALKLALTVAAIAFAVGLYFKLSDLIERVFYGKDR